MASPAAAPAVEARLWSFVVKAGVMVGWLLVVGLVARLGTLIFGVLLGCALWQAHRSGALWSPWRRPGRLGLRRSR